MKVIFCPGVTLVDEQRVAIARDIIEKLESGNWDSGIFDERGYSKISLSIRDAVMESAFYAVGWNHYKRKYPDPKERLIAIMRNIIENDGKKISIEKPYK